MAGNFCSNGKPFRDQRRGKPVASKTVIARYPSSLISKMKSGESNGYFALSAIIGGTNSRKVFFGMLKESADNMFTGHYALDRARRGHQRIEDIPKLPG
jgi:hypothetical protein